MWIETGCAGSGSLEGGCSEDAPWDAPASPIYAGTACCAWRQSPAQTQTATTQTSIVRPATNLLRFLLCICNLPFFHIHFVSRYVFFIRACGFFLQNQHGSPVKRSKPGRYPLEYPYYIIFVRFRHLFFSVGIKRYKTIPLLIGCNRFGQKIGAGFGLEVYGRAFCVKHACKRMCYAMDKGGEHNVRMGTN